MASEVIFFGYLIPMGVVFLLVGVQLVVATVLQVTQELEVGVDYTGVFWCMVLGSIPVANVFVVMFMTSSMMGSYDDG